MTPGGGGEAECVREGVEDTEKERGRGGHRERKRARELRDGAEETRGGEARKAG